MLGSSPGLLITVIIIENMEVMHVFSNYLVYDEWSDKAGFLLGFTALKNKLMSYLSSARWTLVGIRNKASPPVISPAVLAAIAT